MMPNCGRKEDTAIPRVYRVSFPDQKTSRITPAMNSSNWVTNSSKAFRSVLRSLTRWEETSHKQETTYFAEELSTQRIFAGGR